MFVEAFMNIFFHPMVALVSNLWWNTHIFLWLFCILNIPTHYNERWSWSVNRKLTPSKSWLTSQPISPFMLSFLTHCVCLTVLQRPILLDLSNKYFHIFWRSTHLAYTKHFGFLLFFLNFEQCLPSKCTIMQAATN